MATNIQTIGQNKLNSRIDWTRSQLDTIDNRIRKNNKSANDWDFKSGIARDIGDVGLAAAAATGGWSLILTGVGYVSSWIMGKNKSDKEDNIAKLQQQRNAVTAYQNTLLDYQNNLENRDSIIRKAYQDLNNSYMNLSTNYGSEFANLLRQIYYDKNGVTDNINSLFAGRYETFGDIGSGKVAGWNDSSNTSLLTENELNYFNTNLMAIETSDITESIAQKLTRALINSGDTDFALNFKNNQEALQEYISNSLRTTRNTLTKFSQEAGLRSIEQLSNELSIEQKVGKAESERGSSGLKGGTSKNNELIAQLDRDITNFHYQMATAASISNLKNSIENIQLNAASQINAVKFQNAIMNNNARINAINTFRDISAYENTAGVSANESFANAQNDEEEFERLDKMLD